MAIKKKSKKSKKLVYETEKSFRWGLCMKLAKCLYRSTVNDHEIEGHIEDVLNHFTPVKK